MSGGWRREILTVGLLAVASWVRAGGVQLAWPTPNRAFLEGKPIEAFVQPTASGEATSGLFGCVRSGGLQFHEGLDLLPLSRDAKGEATDPVYAAMPGVVRYINRKPAESSYGRYIVLEHPDLKPAVYTLYAHLSAISPGLAEGDSVKVGRTIATMGRSAGGYAIPKDRAHLHFEVGFRLTDNFDDWYRWKKFGNPNEHRVWNGMNLAGLDPLDFFKRYKKSDVDDLADYIADRKPQVVIRISRAVTPDFVRRYPELREEDGPLLLTPAGWEVSFDCAGLPFRWRALGHGDLASYRRNEIRVISVDEQLRAKCRCKQLVVKKGSRYLPGRDLETLTQLLFGLR